MLDIYLITLSILGIIYWIYHRAYGLVNQAKEFSYRETSDKPRIHAPSFWQGFLSYSAPTAISVLLIKQFMMDMMDIPSYSMLPSYPAGVTIFVDKNEFGIRLPISNKFINPPLEPKPGSVAVMQFPLNPSVNYIKRVIATSNDTLSADQTGINLNGQHYPYTYVESRDFSIKSEKQLHDVYSIKLNGTAYEVIVKQGGQLPTIPFQRLPHRTMFVLGDNLTGSSDSRNFGVVPLSYLIGSV